MEQESFLEVRNLRKVYRMGKEKIVAVDNVSFSVEAGEFCCLLGTSGSGKSTLLNLMAGMEKATSGEIRIHGHSIPHMTEKQLAKFRQKNLGFVFQSYNLMGTMTALENVEFPLVFQRVPRAQRRKRAKKMLKEVGLGDRMMHLPKQMSGGQQQRVGIARAFVGKPALVFADEPTGNLDTATAMDVMNLMRRMSKENHQTIVMVTHDVRLASFADKIIHILDGKIQRIEIPDKSRPITMMDGDPLDEGGGQSGMTPPEMTGNPDTISNTEEAVSPPGEEEKGESEEELISSVKETVKAEEERILSGKENVTDMPEEEIPAVDGKEIEALMEQREQGTEETQGTKG